MSPLDDPPPRPVSRDSLPRRLVDAPPGDVARVSPRLDERVYLGEVVSLVEADVLRFPPGRLRPLDRHALEGRLGPPHVAGVGSRDGEPGGYAVPVDEHAPLRPGFRPIGRVRPCAFSPREGPSSSRRPSTATPTLSPSSRHTRGGSRSTSFRRGWPSSTLGTCRGPCSSYPASAAGR